MIKLFCINCKTPDKVYSIITNNGVEPLCSKCIVQREAIDVIKESGRTEVELDIRGHYVTVGQLKKATESVPDTTPVLYQRIEDVYFQNHGWATYEMESEHLDNMSEYVLSWSAYWHHKKNAFVIEAHY